MICNLQSGPIKIPLYDIATLCAGFYIGYNEGKGIEQGPIKEKLLTYGPTTFAGPITLISTKITDSLSLRLASILRKGLASGNLRPEGGSKLKNLPEQQKAHLETQIRDGISQMETAVANRQLIRPVLRNTAVAAIETTIGYALGYSASQFI